GRSMSGSQQNLAGHRDRDRGRLSRVSACGPPFETAAPRPPQGEAVLLLQQRPHAEERDAKRRASRSMGNKKPMRTCKHMSHTRRVIVFINIGHALDHLLVLIYTTAVLTMAAEFGRSFGEMIGLSLGGVIAFGAGSLPAGWLGDRWSRRNMMAVFF